MNISVFSFFSGSGFLDLGFEKAGFNIVEVNELYEPFLEAYKFSRKKMGFGIPKYGYSQKDITSYLHSEVFNEQVRIEKEKGICGFIGGPPCPDFSSAGKNKGRDGENGKLTKTYFDLIIDKEPDFFLFENVKGLLRTKKHKSFYDEMKNCLESNGYIIIDNLLNSLQYNVPQDRERIIMIGFKKSSFKKDIKLVNDFLNTYNWGISRQNVIEIKKLNWPDTNRFEVDVFNNIPTGIIEELTIEFWFDKNDVYNHPNTNDYFKPRQAIDKFKSVFEGDVSKKSFKRLHRWRYSPTVAYGNNEVHLHPYKCRRLSVSEALAIQSLPKEFYLPNYITLTDKFKTIGNGVPFLMSLGIAQSLHRLINNIL
ncbi:DNA cytosine methyltransferase [Bacillus velezensis]|uniref:DNA cytosine methyltransferase n=1 Tax=Bacillus velezensis TaxID=492670 RepID=UPI0035578125